MKRRLRSSTLATCAAPSRAQRSRAQWDFPTPGRPMTTTSAGRPRAVAGTVAISARSWGASTSARIAYARVCAAVAAPDRRGSFVTSRTRAPRPLSAVAVAGAAEDCDELSFREWAEEAEDLVERLRRMRVVDDHAEGLPAFDTLHPPAHGARPRERLARVLQGRARRETGGGRGQRVVDIEASDER